MARGAATRLLLLLAAPWLAGAAPKFPLPPLRTPVQLATSARRGAEAKVASEAATPHVLAFFASEGFAEVFRDCCPEAAKLSPRALLESLRAEVRAAEYAHAFPVATHAAHAGGHHFNVKLGEEYKFLLNSYQAAVDYDATNHSGPSPAPPPRPKNFTDPGPLAEEQIFGLPPFANESKPTWAEASDRMNYVAQNMRRLNFGSVPMFGDATFIFDNDYIKDMILTAPLDTGYWEMVCNHSYVGFTPPYKFNCPAWPRPQTLGTWDHFDHTILTNLDVWRLKLNGSRTSIYEEARKFFERSPFGGDYSTLPNVTSFDVAKYWETNIAGNVRFPEGVRFLIGSFVPLFGTQDGRTLQTFAQTFGWPLVWAFTEFMEVQNPSSASAALNQSYVLNERAVDPTMEGSVALNATFPADAKASFNALWASVEEHRVNATNGQWIEWWKTLSGSQVRVAPSTASSCGGSQLCIGSELKSGTCICKMKGHAGQASAATMAIVV